MVPEKRIGRNNRLCVEQIRFIRDKCVGMSGIEQAALKKKKTKENFMH